MSQPTQQDLLKAIQDMRYRLDALEQMAKALVPEKEWYSRGEFAEKTGLQPRTVSNYLTNKKYGTNQRKMNGRWQIHKSELEKRLQTEGQKNFAEKCCHKNSHLKSE